MSRHSIQNSYLAPKLGTLISECRCMKEARAFSPCHITGFFQICDNSANPLHVGSRGAGVSISQGIETTVTVKKALQDSVRIRINDTIDSAEVSKHVVGAALGKLEKGDCYDVTIDHRVSVPVGAGFGTSGAGALSLALALNEALRLGMTKIQAAQMAHVAEVKCKTGLGTVIAEAFGGLEIRTKQGAPGIGEIIQVPVPKNTIVVSISFGPLSTKRSLANPVTRERVNRFGGDLIDKLAKKPSLTGFLESSRQFAEHVGLITERVRRVLKATDAAGFTCSMPMFGESVFTLAEQDLVEGIVEILCKNSPKGKIVTSDIDFCGARLLR